MFMTINEAIREIGTVSAGITEARRLPRNRKMIRSTRIADTIRESSTSAIEALMKRDSSRRTRIAMPSGRFFSSSLIKARAPEETVNVFAVDCL